MERNLDMMRDLMLEVESRAHDDPFVRVINMAPDQLRSRARALELMPVGGDLDESELVLADPERYHQAQLLYEAGFIREDAYSASSRGPFTDEFNIERLTNKGHDFLDSIRDDSIFATVKEKLVTIGGTASLAVIKAIADGSAKEVFGL